MTRFRQSFPFSFSVKKKTKEGSACRGGRNLGSHFIRHFSCSWWNHHSPDLLYNQEDGHFLLSRQIHFVHLNLIMGTGLQTPLQKNPYEPCAINSKPALLDSFAFKQAHAEFLKPRHNRKDLTTVYKQRLWTHFDMCTHMSNCKSFLQKFNLLLCFMVI